MAKSDILLSVIFLCFMGLVFSDSDLLKLGYYNGEVTAADGTCPYRDGCYFGNLSCRFLTHLRNQSITVRYADLQSAIDAANCQKVSATVYINENFTDTLVARFALGEDSDDETIGQSQIRVWYDNKGEKANILSQLVKTSYNNFIKELITVCCTDFIKNYADALFYSPLAVCTTDKTEKPDDKQNVDGRKNVDQAQTFNDDMKEAMKTMTQLIQQLNATTNLLMEVMNKLTSLIH